MKNDQYSVDETRAKDMKSKQMKYSEIFKYGRAKGWTVKCPGIYDWMPGDTKQRWEENKSISSKFGWTADNIKYEVNKWGYRYNKDFEKNHDSAVFLGCSITFGVGVDYEDTWPYIVSKELGVECINLGQPGVGQNASVRVAREWIDIIKPKYVFFFMQDPGRRELFMNSGGSNHIEQHYNNQGTRWKEMGTDIGSFSKEPNLKQYFEMSNYYRERWLWQHLNHDAMSHICRGSRKYPCKFIARDWIDAPRWNIPLDKEGYGMLGQAPKTWLDYYNAVQHTYTTPHNSCIGRDLLHPGPYQHREIFAPYFLEQLNES